MKGTAGGIRTAAGEVKFDDRRETAESESICQERFL